MRSVPWVTATFVSPRGRLGRRRLEPIRTQRGPGGAGHRRCGGRRSTTRRTNGQLLHRRLHARRGGGARRPSGDNTLALDRRVSAAVPDGGAGAERVVRRRRARAHRRWQRSRSGGQTQFAVASTNQSTQHSLQATLQWARHRLAEQLDVSDLARHAAMSVSTFHRRFAAAVGLAPLQWLNRERTMAARHLLETTDLSVDRVASMSGLGSAAANLRKQLSRQVGMTPTGYRSAHRRQLAVPIGSTRTTASRLIGP